jgi:hypothetical protein
MTKFIRLDPFQNITFTKADNCGCVSNDNLDSISDPQVDQDTSLTNLKPFLSGKKSMETNQSFSLNKLNSKVKEMNSVDQIIESIGDCNSTNYQSNSIQENASEKTKLKKVSS